MEWVAIPFSREFEKSELKGWFTKEWAGHSKVTRGCRNRLVRAKLVWSGERKTFWAQKMLCGEGHWSSSEGHSHQEGAEKIYSLILLSSFPPSSPDNAPHWLNPTETVMQENLLTQFTQGLGQLRKKKAREWVWNESEGASGRCVGVQRNKISSQRGKGRMHNCRPAVSSPCLKEFSRTSPLTA